MPPQQDPLGLLLSDPDLVVADGLATVLVAPHYESAEAAAAALAAAHARAGGRAEILRVETDGTLAWRGASRARPDEDGWAALAAEAEGSVVVVHGPLAEAAAAALRFVPAISVTDGGSVEEARLRLSASARKARMLGSLQGGDFDALFGARTADEHGVLSDLVGRIVGLERLGGALAASRVALYPDGLDNLAQVKDLAPVLGDGAALAYDMRDLGDLPERLSRLTRKAYLPVMSPFDAEPDGPQSRSFGAAFLPAGRAWPSRDGVPLTLVLQLDLAALPAPAQALAGRQGTLQVFLDLEGEPSSLLVRTVDPGAPGAYVQGPGPARRPWVVMGWREVGDHPGGTEFEDGTLERFAASGLERDAIALLGAGGTGQVRADAEAVAHAVGSLRISPEAAEAVAAALAHHPGDKLLGWPTRGQGPGWPRASDGRRMVPFLQFGMDGDEGLAPALLAGDGTAQIFVTEEGDPSFALRRACG